MRRRLAALAALGLAASMASTAMPAASASDVTVALNNPGGSRTLYVETVLGAPLTTLDFGTMRSEPFRVRVVDDTMDRSPFYVTTSLSNLYLVSGNSYDWNTTIPSSAVSVNYPANPLGILNPQAVVAPLLDITETVTGTLCTTITAQGGTCNIAMTGVQALRQVVDLAVNAADLTNLPLVPQTGETGAYTSPDYSGIGAGDPGKPGSFDVTHRKVITGAINTVTSLLDSVKAAYATVLAGTNVTAVVDPAVLAAALRTAMGGTAYDALVAASGLQPVIDALSASVEDVVTNQILAQSGTYLSYPKLDVTLPTNQASGSYQGTLVVTAVQG
jgi:hypothetical protein